MPRDCAVLQAGTMNDCVAVISPYTPSVVGVSTRRANFRRVSIVARIAKSRSITVAVYRVVSIGAQARSIRIAIIGHVSIGVVAVPRLIGVALIGIGRLVAIPVPISIASTPIGAVPVTAVIGCRPDT